jgi:hypothetical protein
LIDGNHSKEISIQEKRYFDPSSVCGLSRALVFAEDTKGHSQIEQLINTIIPWRTKQEFKRLILDHRKVGIFGCGVELIS